MGCKGSKAAVAAPAAQQTLVTPPAEVKPHDGAAAPAVAPAAAVAAPPVPLTVKIASVHGIRAADTMGNKSDVFVEVCIEGKDSKVVTDLVVGKAAPWKERVGGKEGEKDAIEVKLNFAGKLQDYKEGDKIIFTVKDKDMLASDILGRAVVTDGHFGGKLDLEGCGDGYKGFLMVQLGDGDAMADALKQLQESAKKMAEATSALAAAAASGDQTKMVEAAAKAKDVLVEEMQHSAVCCGC